MARPAAFRWLSFLLFALSSAGCFGPQRTWTDDVVWSPDGRRGAVLGRDLYVTDTTGSLTPLHVPGVYRVAWLGDSERLAVARSRPVTAFADIVAAVGSTRAASIIARAEQSWFAFTSFDDPLEPSHGIPRDAAAMTVYLRERHADEVRELDEEDRRAIAEATPDLHALAIVRIAGDRAEVGPAIYEDLTPVRAIRPAPNGRVIAFVTENEEFLEDPTITTWVVPADGSTPAARVEEDTGRFPDWTGNGASLVFHVRSGGNPNIGSLGVIHSRPVLGPDGVVTGSLTSTNLVNVIYEYGDVIRVAGDGRVLFNGFVRSFPHPSSESTTILTVGQEPSVQHMSIEGQRLFAFDPAHPDLPPAPLIDEAQFESDALGFFEASPDRTRVLYGTFRGIIRVLRLSDGSTERIPLGLDRDEPYAWRDMPRALWAGTDAFVYARPRGDGREFVLRRGASEIVLSRTWPADLVGPVARSVTSPSR